MANDSLLTLEDKREIFNRVLKTLDAKFYKPELLNQEWLDTVEAKRNAILASPSAEDFELSVSELIQTLKTSHLGFFHDAARRASSRAALSATYLADQTDSLGSRWIFQDVHAGGAAALSGIQPGNILLAVNGKEVLPPIHPVFQMGKPSTLTVISNDGEQRDIEVTVARPKGKKLQFVEPTLVESRRLSNGAGYLKVSMFPGMVGVDVSNAMTEALDRLGSIKGLVVDLRGNTGGGAGSLRLMSLLAPGKMPVGYAADRRWQKRDLATERKSFPRFGNIPASSRFLWLLGLRFLPSLLSKKPIVLQTEGLGPRSYEGNIVLLVNRHTASAAEMVTIFGKENGLVKLVGESTAGRLLSATSAKVGNGFRLALPTGAYYTWHGTALEGSPIVPDVAVPFSWRERRKGEDRQMEKALELLN